MELPVLLLLFSSALINTSDAFFRALQRTQTTTSLPVQITDAPPNYPALAISQLIRQNAGFYRDRFADDAPFVETRFLDDEWDLCDTSYTIESPTHLRRSSDNQMVIIAQDFQKNGIRQNIRNIRCKNANKECTFNAFPATYVSYCKQVDTERKLFVFDPKTNNISEELIFAPACCNCKLRKKDE